MWGVTLPTSIQVSTNKRVPLNLNYYRNAHPMVLNKAKKLFKAEVAAQIRKLPKLPQLQINYTLFVATRRSLDVANVCSIVDKFFSDALVELGRLPDDDYENLVKVSYAFGGVDRNHPRVEASLEPYGSATTEPDNAGENPGPTKEDPMRIAIVQTEIEEAVRTYIRSLITVREGMEINMEFSATRGADGLTAAIDIVPAKTPGTKARAAATTAVAAPAAAPARQISSRPEAREPTAASPFRRQPAAPVQAEPGEQEDEGGDQVDELEREAAAPEEDLEAQPEPKASIFSNLRRPQNPPPGAQVDPE